jgi:hypothetical protein
MKVSEQISKNQRLRQGPFLSELSRPVSRDWINTGQGLRGWLVPASIAPNAFKAPLNWLAIALLLVNHC